MSLTKGFI